MSPQRGRYAVFVTREGVKWLVPLNDEWYSPRLKFLGAQLVGVR